MAKNTSILLGNYFEDFISKKVQSGQYSSAGEVVRAALRIFEQEEAKKDKLIQELKKGEKSGFITDFNRNNLLSDLHNKYVND
jgi:antitoxin ParD1/3/4